MKNQQPKIILLVEDDTTTMLVETHLLKGFGYVVVTAKSGEEAVQIATENDKIALVLMDIDLGAGMDGVEAASQILAKRQLPIVFLTSHTEKEYLERIKEVAGYGCVIKNSGDVMLQSSIEMALNLFQSQMTLAASEAKYRRLIENSNDIIYSLTSDGVFIFVSPAWTRLLGHASAEIEGHSFTEFVHPEDLPLCYEFLRKVVQIGERHEGVEYRVRHKNGEWRWHTSTAAPVKDLAGAVIGYDGLARDITARKLAQAALHESERNLAMTFSSIGDAVMATDAQGRIVRMNRVAEHLTGWPLSEAKGRPLDEVFCIVNQHTRQSVENPVAKVLETGKIQGLANDTLLVSRQGMERIIADSAAAIVDDATGQIVGVVLVYRDVTESYAFQQQIKIRNKAIETSIDAIAFSDPKGIVTYVNPTFLEMWGLAQAEEALGKSVLEFWSVRENAGAVIKALETHGRWDGELIARRKGGSLFDAQLSSSVVKDEDGRIECMMASFRDISTRKQAEENIRRLNETLEQRVMDRTAELEAFAYSISHDLRAPLRAMDSFARIMAESHSAHVGKDGHHCLQVIQDNCRQMDLLIQGLLTFSRLSRQPLNKPEVDLHDLVGSVLKDFNAERKERAVKIILGNLPSCEADPLLLHQVWSSLISNAIKFTRNRKEAHIEIGSQQKNNQCVYFVKDNGVGFDMQYVHKLFNVFARLHRAEDYEGTGVGLAIVQRIILRHGGRIWIESEVNKGTTVYFTLK